MKSFLQHARRFLIPAVLIALLGFWLLSINNKDQAPDVTFTTLEGQKFKLADLQGKVVLVNFWATDCPGCIKEMPDLIKTYNDYKGKGFELVAVAMSYDPPSHVLNYSQKNALPFPVMHDGHGEIAASFNDVRVTPTAFIVDKEGKIIRRIIGELDFAALHALLDEQLKG
ncbi:MAG: thioredoxin [Betaproteobacteria bacterium HGW-Betaproteobacteria-8]|nr:MAG: thioredoxin [Betaproteobacteria bacterium HGW-Betaproteobacteria-8]